MYYIYGAGGNSWGVISFFGRDQIIAIVDSNEEKAGSCKDGVPIISFSQLEKQYEGETILISVYIQTGEILKKLTDAGFDNYFVCPGMLYGVRSGDEYLDYMEKKGVKWALYGNNPLSEVLVNKANARGTRDQILAVLDSDEGYTIMEQGSPCVLSSLEELGMNIPVLTTADPEKRAVDINSLEIKRDVTDVFSFETFHGENRKFKGIHQGKRCFIIGNGPSLRVEDLETLYQNKEISFGCNAVFHVFGQTGWRPDYYVFMDSLMPVQLYDSFLPYAGMKIFLRDFSGFPGKIRFPKTNICHGITKRYFGEPPKFSADIAEQIYSGASVTYDMIQIAAYMGFSEIYLLGNDFNYKENEVSDHFYGGLPGIQRNAAHPDQTRVAFGVAEQYAREHGFRIFNATRGGALEQFERVDFDSLFPGESQKI